MNADAIKAKSLFLNAVECCSPEEWPAFLDRECGENSELRRQVERLLAGHRKDVDLAEQGQAAFNYAMPTLAESRVQEQPGDTIGPYKLLEQIGEGGFGVVFMAEQTAPVTRKVALKVIKPGMDTREVIARFEAERQALALMDHPNIAKVLDAGATETGRPYFVMELVRGVPITEYCDQAQLTPRQRLELFVTVCQAVQHAHQKGIIHRDIKPTNVLVTLHDDKPVVKVIDFGVAKATSGQLTDKTLFTGFAQMIGTPLYMSPEQAALSGLDIDTRSDIYSLGVLLYELLTGTTPFDKMRLHQAAFEEIRRIIREEEPQKPSTRLSSLGATLPSVSAVRKTEPRKLSQLVRGDLDWIVMKALEKDRARRYDTANGFAADVLRYLADEPVEACPPAATYRFRKFARRNKVALATTAAVCVALVAGIIGTTWQAVRATREATRASNAETLAQDRYTAERAARAAEQEQRRVADLQRQRAEANFDKARRAVDEYLSQVTESELLSVPGLQPLREDLLRAALTFYAEFTVERADDPTIQRELASAHFRLGRIHSELGDADAAATANGEAIRLYEQLRDVGQFDSETQVALAWAYLFAKRYDDTAQLCQDVLLAEPGHAEARSLLADTWNALGGAESEKNDIEAALAHHRQAFELRESLVRDDPDNPGYLAQLGSSLNNLGVLLVRQGKSGEALPMYERAVEYMVQAYDLVPHSLLWGRWLCASLGNVAGIQASLGQEQEALATYQRLIAVSRKRAFENPAVTSLRGDQYQALLSLARYQQQLGDTGEATRSFREAREVLENIPRETPDQLYELATVYGALAQPDEGAFEPTEDDVAEQQRNIDLALETLQQAVDAGFSDAQKLQSERQFDVIRERDDFHQILTTLETAAEAQRLARSSSESDDQTLADRQRAAELLTGIIRERPGTLRHQATLGATLHSIGVIQTGLGQFDEAEKSFDEALKLREELLKEQSENPDARVDVLATRAALGQLDWDRDRPQDAHRLFQEILTECQRLAVEHGEDSRLQAGIVVIERSIANTYGEIGLLEEYLQSVDRGLKAGRLHDPAGDCRGAHVLAALGRLAEHRQLCQLIVDKWGKYIPAQTVWAAAMNRQPVVEVEQLLQLAERVITSDLDPLWKFKAATAWYWAGEYNRALEIMLAAREKVATDRSSACLHWYAMVFDKLGQKEVSALYFEEAEAEFLKSADMHARAGAWSTWAEDQAARRLAWHELRGTADLQDPWPHLAQAGGYRLVGEIEKADRELAAAVAARPDDANAWMARARLLTHWDDPARPAEADWQRAVELAGDDPLPWIQRGYWYAEHGQQQQADADFAKAASLSPHLATTPFSAEAAAGYQQAWASQRGMPVEFTNSIGMKLRLIPPGEFMMGTPEEVAREIAETSGTSVLDQERKAIADEAVPHPVLLSRPYYLGQFEVTRGQFRQFVEASGYRTELERNGLGGWSHVQGRWVRRAQHVWSSPGEWQPEDDEPACLLTWSDALAFCEWLSRTEGLRYALPTEAQWEFACRAGTTEETYAATGETLADIAWTNELIGSSYDAEQYRPQPVGRKRPNAFGLHDMLGNVWEFCSDRYAPIPNQAWPRIDPTGPLQSDSQVIRGGAWYRSGSAFARSSGRNFHPDASSDAGIGFRVAIVTEAEGLNGEIERAYAGWQAHEDFQELVRETAERHPDDLMLLAKLEGHSERICAVAFLPDRQRMVSVGRDRAIRIWDLGTGSVLSTLPVTGGNVGEEADVSADGRFVALIVEKGVRIWDLEHGKQICEMFPQNVAYLNRIRFSPDGTRIVTSGKPYVGVLWNASTGEQVQRFDMDESQSLAVEFSPDGGLLAMGTVGRVRLFDVESGHVLGDAQLPQNRHVLSLAFAPSGDSLACGQMGGHATVIDVNSRRVTGSLINPESSPHAHVNNMRFLDDKRLLLMTRFDGALELWDLARTTIVATAASGDGTGKRLAVSPDGRYALTAHGEVWDHESESLKPSGDYALRLWQLPRTAWTEPERPSSGAAVSEPEEELRVKK